MPADAPNIMPDAAFTVTMAVFPLLQVPPEMESLSEAAVPVHKKCAPVTTDGELLTVTGTVT